MSWLGNKTFVSRWQRLLAMDAAQTAALGAKAWQAVSGPITISLIVTHLSIPEQGVYYSLVSLLAFQNLFELGLCNLLVSHAGRQAGILAALDTSRSSDRFATARPGETIAAADLSDPQWLHREESARVIARLSVIRRGAHRWFLFATLGFVLLAWGIGFQTLSGVSSEVGWLGPLICVIPVAGCIVWLSPDVAVLEGLGDRIAIYRLRLFQMVVGSCLVWLTLVLNGGLWSLLVASLVQAIATLAYLSLRRDRMPPAGEIQPRQVVDFTWRQDVLPGQWRLAVLGIAQHTATQLFTLILLAYHGEASAATIGVMLGITGPIQMLALTWLQTNLAVAAGHHGSGDRELAGMLWRRAAVVSTGLLLLAFTTLIALLSGLLYWQPALQARFLTPFQTAALSCGCIANHLVAVQGFYVVSRFAKPIFAPALTGFLTCALLVYLGGRFGGTNGLLLGYFLGIAGVLLPLHTAAYCRLRRS
ncbi:MAG: hypothetical protein AAGJ40_01225 [Planctomycetota bacterium]